jgi:ribonuclease HI
MPVPAPHFVLYSRASRSFSGDQPGRWSFTLQSADGADQLLAEDAEPDTSGERLELLAVVRGLEALPQPAHVTLVTTSPYVNRVLKGGLDDWRANGWCWERHGEMVPVKNADLWRRVDRALDFHQISQVTCHGARPRRRIDQPYRPSPNLAFAASNAESHWGASAPVRRAGHTCRTKARRSLWARKVLLASKIAKGRIRRRLRGWGELLGEAKREAATYPA